MRYLIGRNRPRGHFPGFSLHVVNLLFFMEVSDLLVIMYLPTSLGSFSVFPKYPYSFRLKSEPINSFDCKSTYPFFNINELFSLSIRFIFSALKVF